jgi:hypothetical protein
MRNFAFSILLVAISLNVTGQQIDTAMLKKHIYYLASDSLMGRGFGTKGGRMAADYIVQQFADAGIQPWNGKYRHEFVKAGMMLKTEGANIIGWIEGTDPVLKNEFILVGGHYDHVAYLIRGDKTVVYNGADDNASGTATVIELGRWLANNKSKLKRSVILVAFDGEESGLIGSSQMVRNNIVPVDKIKMMFSLDMVGMLSTYGGIDLVGNATLRGGTELLNGIAAKYGIDVKLQGRNIEQQTDTSPFGQKGIPSVHVFTSTVSPYHKPEDDADLLDYNGIATIANFMIETVTTLSSKDELKANRLFVAKETGKGLWASAGFSIGAGTAYHDYSNNFYSGKPVLAANAGLFAKIRFTKRLSLQPEVMYRTVGSEHATGTLRTHEVTIPVNIRFRLTTTNGGMLTPDMFLLIGPYYSYRFYGSLNKQDMDFTNTFSNQEKGLNYGIGIGMMKMNMIFSTQNAFTSIDKNSKLMQSYSSFSIYYTF